MSITTRRSPRGENRRTSICKSTIAIASIVLAQFNPLFIGSADAQNTVTWLGTGSGGGLQQWGDAGNWIGGVAPVTTDALIFTGTAGTITTNDLVALAVGSGGGTAITFDNTATDGAFTLGGNQITLSGNILATGSTGPVTHTISLNMVLDANRTITTNVNNNITVTGIISETGGSQGLIKTGTGSLTLSGANTYSGNTAVSGGILLLDHTSALGTGTALTLSGGALQATSAAIGSIGKAVIVAANSIVSGSETIEFTNTLTNSGGNRAITNAVATGTAGFGFILSGGVDLSNNDTGRTLTIASGTNTTLISGVVTDGGSSPGSLSLTGSGLGGATIAGANTHSGTTTLTSGTTILDNTSALGTSILALNAGALQATSVAIGSIGNVVRLSNSTTISGSNPIEFTNSFTHSGGNRTLTNSVASGTAVGVTLSGPVFLSEGTAGRIMTVSGNGTTLISGVISDGTAALAPGILVRAGAGTLILTGANTFTGEVRVDAGTISVDSVANAGIASPLGAGVGDDSIIRIGSGNNTGTLIYNGTGGSTNRQVLIGRTQGTGNGQIQNDGSGPLVFTNPAFNVTGVGTVASAIVLRGSNTSSLNEIVGIIADNTGAALGVAKNDEGTWKLTGANTYSGNTTLTAGTLINGAVGAIPAGSTIAIGGGFLEAVSTATGSIGNVVLVIAGGGGVSGANTIEFYNTVTNSAGNRSITNNISGIGKELILSGTVNLSEGNAARTLTLGGSGNTLVSGVIQNGGTGNVGAGIFAKEGAGTLTFTNTGNSYTGGTTINGGTLLLGAAEVIPNTGTVTLRREGAGSITPVLDLNGNSESIGGLTLGSTVAAGMGGQTPMVVNTGGGSPVLNLGGNVTYNSGASGVENGQATIAVDLTLNANRLFTVNDSSAAAIDLVVSGAIGNNATGTAARSITKTGAGAGVMLLSNPGNSYTGGTVVDSGTLLLGAGQVIPNTGTVTVRRANSATATDGVLDLNGFSQTIGALTMGQTATGSAGGGGQAPSVVSTGGPAGLTLGGNVTYNAGNAGFENGTATIAVDLGLGVANRTFTVGDSPLVDVDLLVTGVISNGGTAARTITKTGAGTVALTSTANTYSGATAINGGTVLVSSLADGGVASSIGQGSAAANQLTLSGATLAYTGAGDSTNKLFTIGAGTAGATIDSSGTGPVVFTGTGSLVVTNNAAARTLTLTGTNTGGTNALSAVIPSTGTNGAISVLKSGTNTWQLNALNNYTGGTTVAGGKLLVGSGGSLGSGPVTVTGGTLGGSGDLGAITTSPGAIVSPGNSIGAATATSFDMSLGGTFKLEIDSTSPGAPGIDTLTLSAGLTLDGVGTLSILDVSDLNLTPNVLTLPFEARLAFITYVGAQSGLFSVGGTAVRDYDLFPTDLFTVGANIFGIDYNDGSNASLVVVPEPGTVGSLIGGFGLLLGLRRRRDARRG